MISPRRYPTGRPITIAVLDDYQDVARSLAEWSTRLPEAEMLFFHEHFATEDEVVRHVASADVIVAMRERTPFAAGIFARLPMLCLLVTTGMRNAAIDLQAASAYGVTVCGTGSHASSTAELTWALILELFRGVGRDDAAMRTGAWQTRVGIDLCGERLGLAGLGRQGSQVAKIGAAFGMELVAWSPHLTTERAASVGATVVSKAELFASAKCVSLHLVLSDSTRYVVTERELRSMRPDSFLVNTARAGLIDQDALRRALSQGWIAGAALDVFDTEPLPAEDWLRHEPRTVLSPHMGYVSLAGYRRYYEDALDDIVAFGAGEPVRVLS